jgi:hypothetical protein
MTKRRFYLLPLAILSIILTFSSCKKSPEYVPEPYACDCGDYTWQGSSYNLLSANYIIPDSLNSLSRRYYITADIRAEGEVDARNVNLIIESPDVIYSILDLDDENFEFSAFAQEVNQNDELLPVREYAAITGRIRVTPAIFGGIEPVEYSLTMREVVNEELVGAPFTFTGKFQVNVTYEE